MSDDTNDIQSGEDAEFAEFEMETTSETTKPRGNRIAWLAVVLAAAAFAMVGYTVVNEWLTADAVSDSGVNEKIANLDQRLSETNDAVTAVESRVGEISHPDYSADIDALRRDLGGQLQGLESLPGRMTSIENSVAALAGISAGARETFLLAEAEYYLQIANAQLQLANNPHLATLALGMADERVTQMSDPGLTAVRRAISDELAALEVMEKPDIEGATLTLASLARVVESLPLASTGPVENEDEADTDQSGVDRAWGSVKNAMSGLVKVTPPDRAKLKLISPDAEFFLRNNMALQLQSARLALLRGEQSIFEQALDDASALLNTYFDVGSEQVTSAQLTISEIRNSQFTLSMPDISESLRLLRQFRSLRGSAE